LPDRNSIILAGIDTGGTFTDVVVLQHGRLRHCKVLSTPDDPSRSIREGLERLGVADRALHIVHGTTVGTNAVLEGKGVRVAYVTSAGFADVLTLGRQNREQVYRLIQPAQAPPVPRELCLEVATRPLHTGELDGRASDEELQELARMIHGLGVEAVAVNLLNSFLVPEEERRIADALGDGLFVSLSSIVLPEILEYERGIATWLNASVGPVLGRYLNRLAERLPRANISVMQSSGTTVAAGQAAERSVRLLLSGPAGGIAAARLFGAVTGQAKLMTLDMGGTSTDVSLLDGTIPLTNSSTIGRWPLTITTVDIHTIGAGGGSIARVDAGGMLLVGPESAGADPGPACYGKGREATVTDANVVLGRIPPDTLLGGYMPLEAERSKAAIDRLGKVLGCSRREAALGAVRIANEHMARALRVISVERGHDPHDHALFCFGGAGGLHACELAELLNIPKVILPALAGVLSAQGMLASEPGRDLSQAVLADVTGFSDADLEARFATLESAASGELAAEGIESSRLRIRRQLDLRYQGQSASLVLDYTPDTDHAESFHVAHEAASGHRLDRVVELVAVRVGVRAPAPVNSLEKAGKLRRVGKARQTYMPELKKAVPVIERRSLAQGASLAGPAIVTDPAATAWLAPGWVCEVDAWGNLVLERG